MLTKEIATTWLLVWWRLTVTQKVIGTSISRPWFKSTRPWLQENKMYVKLLQVNFHLLISAFTIFHWKVLVKNNSKPWFVKHCRRFWLHNTIFFLFQFILKNFAVATFRFAKTVTREIIAKSSRRPWFKKYLILEFRKIKFG